MIVNVRVVIDETRVVNPANILNEVTATISREFERIPGVGQVDTTEVTIDVEPVEVESPVEPVEPAEENDV